MLVRDQSTTQVGLAKPLVLRDLTEEQMAWLASLEGVGTSPSSREVDAHRPLWDALDRHDLLDTDSTVRPDRVRIHGAGALALMITRGLTRAGVHSLVMVDSAPSHVEPPGTYSPAATGMSCAAAAAWTLRDQAPQLRWGDATGDVDLEIIVTVGSAPVAVTLPSMVEERPHLVVATDEAGATVGPLVQPGETACTRCVDMHHTDRDPGWPYLSLQCGPPRRPWVAPASMGLVAGLAVREVLAHMNGVAVPSRQWRVTDGGDLEQGLQSDPLRPHPQCGCGAAGPVGDEVAARRAHFGVVRDQY